MAIARAFGEDPHPSPADAARRALAGRCALLILDGTEVCDNLDAVLDVAGSCCVLITTRRHSDAPNEWNDLLPLPLAQSILLLKAWGRDYAADESASNRICKILDGLPLAIFLAGRYMAQRRQMAADYLSWLEETPLEALNQGEKQHKSISLLMEHSLAQVGEIARNALGVTGVLAFEAFDSELISIALEIKEAEANRCLGELVDYGLLLRPDIRYQVTHSLEHTYSREKLPPEKNILRRLSEYYESFMQECNVGMLGKTSVEANRAHILAIQLACCKAAEWDAVRSLTLMITSCLSWQDFSTENIEALKVGLFASRAEGRHDNELLFLNSLGSAYTKIGEPQRAIKRYEQALDSSRKNNNQQAEADVLNRLGTMYVSLGDPRKGIELHEQALAICREAKDPVRESRSLVDMGQAHAKLDETRQAILRYKQALDSAREIEDVWKKQRAEANALNSLGKTYADLDEPQLAIEFFLQALSIFHEIGEKRGMVSTLGDLGDVYANIGKRMEAIQFHERALAISREIGGRRGESTALDRLGQTYSILGDPQLGIDFLEQALNVTRRIKDKRGEGNALINLGRAYIGLGAYQKAIESYEPALLIFQEIGDRSAEGNALGNLSQAYIGLGESKKAIEFYQQALAIKRETGDHKGESTTLGYMGQTYADLGDLKKAIGLIANFRG